MLILGLNAFHADAAACLVRDGKLIAAAEEERFRRIKHWAGFPSEAIRWCFSTIGAKLSDIDIVALNQDSSANMARRILFLARTRPSLQLIADRLRARRQRASAAELLEQLFPGQAFRGRLEAIEHPTAHLASAFYVSPFEDAVAVSVDGFGDFASAAWGVGSGTEIRIEGRVHFPHSLGIFYQAITQHLGFPHYGDEYKVMGLAPYGQATFLQEMGQIVHDKPDGGFELDLRYFRHHIEGIAHQWENGTPEFAELFSPALETLLGPRRVPNEPLEQRHKDLAHSAQSAYEKVFFNLIGTVQNRSGLTDIAVAGGCGNNSVANGKIRRRTRFRRVYVHAAPGDAGGAIGAAFAAWHKAGGPRRFVMDHAYWGPTFGSADFSALLDARRSEIEAARCTIEVLPHEDALCARTAASIAAGNVIGWFQGAMEWGPRALGNRSILCDPRRADMKSILNAKIKRREGFRPFAPSVLEDAVSEWFEEDDAVPFMTQVFQIREEKRAQVPAVTHADGSGRLQTVYPSTNPRYARLIEAFRAQTGVPMVLNTSFNENEPVVCRPEEALDCFLRTKMDVLVLGDIIVSRALA